MSERDDIDIHIVLAIHLILKLKLILLIYCQPLLQHNRVYQYLFKLMNYYHHTISYTLAWSLYGSLSILTYSKQISLSTNCPLDIWLVYVYVYSLDSELTVDISICTIDVTVHIQKKTSTNIFCPIRIEPKYIVHRALEFVDVKLNSGLAEIDWNMNATNKSHPIEYFS